MAVNNCIWIIDKCQTVVTRTCELSVPISSDNEGLLVCASALFRADWIAASLYLSLKVSAKTIIGNAIAGIPVMEHNDPISLSQPPRVSPAPCLHIRRSSSSRWPTRMLPLCCETANWRRPLRPRRRPTRRRQRRREEKKTRSASSFMQLLSMPPRTWSPTGWRDRFKIRRILKRRRSRRKSSGIIQRLPELECARTSARLIMYGRMTIRSMTGNFVKESKVMTCICKSNDKLDSEPGDAARINDEERIICAR